MEIIKTALEGVVIIRPKIFGDARGYFFESFNQKGFTEKVLGMEYNPEDRTLFVQDNESKSSYGVVRGLHFQKPPYAQAKLIRVIKGKVLDVAVDIRKGSPTYMKWVAVKLSQENKKMLFIPKGCLHGFVTLTDNVEVMYKVNNFYSPENDRSVRFDDPTLGVEWGVTNPILSQKDLNAPLLKDSDVKFTYKG